MKRKSIKEIVNENGSKLLVAYDNPRIFLTGLEFEDPWTRIITTFDGLTISSERRFLDRYERGSGIEKSFTIENPSPEYSDSKIIRLYATPKDNLEDPGKIIEELLLSGPEMQVWEGLTYSNGSCNWNLGLRTNKYVCVYCGTPMRSKSTGKISDAKHYFLAEAVYSCLNCGWWRIEGTLTHREPEVNGHLIKSEDFNYTAYGAVRKYDLNSIDVPISELRLWLQRHPFDVVHTNPTAFEKLIAACFRDKFGDLEVIHVGHSGDEGIDLLLVRGNKVDTLVQIKRRENIDATQGIEAVRELNGVLFRKGIAKGMVVTTAKRFTKGAIREAESTPESFARFHVDLLAFGDVVDLLNCKKNDIAISERAIEYLAAIDLRTKILKLRSE